MDYVSKPLAKASAKAEANRVSVEFVEADVTRLSATGIGAGFDLVVDNGCLHGMSGEDRDAYVREVTAAAAPEARLVIVAFVPGSSFGVPGIEPAEVERRFGASWQLLASGDETAQDHNGRNPARNYLFRAGLVEIAPRAVIERKSLPSAQSQRKAGGVAGMVIAATAVATATNSTPMNTAVAPCTMTVGPEFASPSPNIALAVAPNTARPPTALPNDRAKHVGPRYHTALMPVDAGLRGDESTESGRKTEPTTDYEQINATAPTLGACAVITRAAHPAVTRDTPYSAVFLNPTRR